MEGRKFLTDLVVSPLTSQAILGIDFLQAQKATIDLGHRLLHLRESSCDIPLVTPESTPLPMIEQHVRIANTVEVPPRCMMEVTSRVETDVELVWLVEEVMLKHVPVAIARAIVEPRSSMIPVCVLNLLGEPVTLYAGSIFASMTPSRPPAELPLRAMEGGTAQVISEEKLCMLCQLVEESGAELDSGEKEIFYDLLSPVLMSYIASSTADLGKTNKLRHHIDTGSSPPIKLPV